MFPVAEEADEEGWLEFRVDGGQLIREGARLEQHEIEVEEEAREEEIQNDEIEPLQLRNAQLAEELATTKADLAYAEEKLGVDSTAVPAGPRSQGTALGLLPYMAMVYVSLCWVFAGLLIFHNIHDFGKREDQYTFVDAFYLTSYTASTVGYGDIPPREAPALIISDVVGIFGSFVSIILCHFVSRLAIWLDQRFLSQQSHRMRFFYQVLSSIGTIVIVVSSGIAGLYIFERERLAHDLPDHSSSRIFLDILHLTVMTTTTVGYGDLAFATAGGRLFATLWIPFSTTFYSVAITFLVQAILRAMSRLSLRGPCPLFTEEEKLMLHRQKPDMASATSSKWLPLHTLAVSGEYYIMHALSKHKADINAADKDDWTVLDKAIIGKNQAITDYLLRDSANPFVRDKGVGSLCTYIY